MSNLNEQQLAVTHWVVNGKGSLNLIARAGCGKTFTLIQGVVRTIVENGGHDIALMAYNKSAALEFEARLQNMAVETGDARFKGSKFVQAGTVHSFGFGAVRRWAGRVKVDDKKVYNIIDQMAASERNEITRTAIQKNSGPIKQLVSLAKQSAFGFLTAIDNEAEWFALAEHHAVNEMVNNVTLNDIVPWAIRVLRASIDMDNDVIDFDDMILAPLVHDLKVATKRWVLIDEAQDTNAARRALAFKMLDPVDGRLIAVGDDRQAIYGFTGADSDALELIKTELGSSVLPLTITYRCPKAVVAEANRLVPDLVAHESAPEGIVRSLSAPRVNGEKPKWFVDQKLTGADGVLCRNTKPLLETAYAMLSKGVGCRVEGRDIGEGLVKLVQRWKRVGTLEQLREKLVDHRDREVQKWMAKGREDRAQGVEDRVAALLTISDALSMDGKVLVDDLVTWIRNLFGDTRPGDRPNVVTLSTVHKAKGREWDRVFILYRSETMPSKWARKPWQLAQEANLEYVAITRAKRELVFVEGLPEE
jgi:superfamily I DNA/RNA helicase